MRRDAAPSADEAARASIRQNSPSVYAVGAALLALGTLATTAQGLPILGVFALAILVSRFTTARLRDHTFLRWLLRILMIAVVWALTPNVYNAGTEALGSAHTRNLFGEICAAEMTLQFWRYRSYDPKRSNLILLLMTGLTFLTASNAYEGSYIRLLTPVFLIFLGLMARDYRVRVPSAQRRRTPDADRAMQARRRPAFFPAALRLAALFAALAIGWVGYTETNENKVALTEFSNRVLFKSSWEMDMGGMSAQPELGSAFGLRGSAERVLRLENFGGDPHLDGVPYTDYSDGRWGPAASQLIWRSAGDTTLRPAPTGRRRGPATNVTVTRLVSDNPLLYLPLNTAEVDLGDSAPLSFQGTTTGAPFRVRAPAPFTYSLTVPENVRYQGILAQAIDPAQRAKYLAIPPQSERFPREEVAALARRIVGKDRKSADRVEDISRYLTLHHDYSLYYHRGDRRLDPIADFLLSSPPKAAHCEFFATGAAVLLRCVGVPTRYVTGYYVHENEGASAMVVRQRDAHAWCEAWVDGTGWVTVDATPGGGKPDALAGLTPVEPWRRVLEWLQDKMQAITANLANITPLEVEIGLVMVVALSAGGWFFYRTIWRRRLGTVAAGTIARYTVADATLGELSQRFEAAWQKRTGTLLPTNRTYGEYLRGLPAATDGQSTGIESTGIDGKSAAPPFVTSVAPEAIDAARVFAHSYEAARFGGPAALDDARRAEMVKVLEQLEEKKTTE